MGKWVLNFFVVFVICIIFRNWIFSGVISSGDFGYYSFQHIEDIKFLSIWDPTFGGMGSSVLSSLWLSLYSTSTVKLSLFWGWSNNVHIFWYFPYIICAFLSAIFLFRNLFKENTLSSFAGFIYTVNTYALMIVAGGQMGVALAYSIAPLILVSFIKLIDRFSYQPLNIQYPMSDIKYSIIVGLLFTILVMFDLRLAYIMIIAIFLYMIINFKFQIFNFKSLIFIFVIPLGITGLLHSYWLLPAIFSGGNTVSQLGDIYITTGAVKFFSFAKLENTISLLHPNWPENLFGKVSFMKPEFILLPILAYASLLFLGRKTKGVRLKTDRYILFFALLGLVGAFLAKGSNEPFGQIYIWMFDHIPGFIMFRDSTKFYLLTALSYSVLIPFSIYSIYQWLSKIKKISNNSKIFNFQNAFVLFFLSYFLYLLHPAVLGQLNGTLKRTEVPDEYGKLGSYLSSQSHFFRTLWIPTSQRFGFYSNIHPAIPAQMFFDITDTSKLIKNLEGDKATQLLVDSGVKYFIVPYDSGGEIFIKDGKYDDQEYKKTIKYFDTITWLRKLKGFGRIAVYEVPNPKDHFWSPSIASNAATALSIQYKFVDPTKYVVSVKNAQKDDILVFSEGYDNGWRAIDRNKGGEIKSIKYEKRFNSFVLPEGGSYDLEVYYKPQELVNIGVWISLSSLVMILGSLLVLELRDKKETK